MTSPSALYDRLQSEASTVLIGNEEVLRHITVAMLTRGHVLLEGVPGVAKTTIATLVANATDRNERSGFETLAEAVGEEAVQRTLSDARWSA